LVGGGLGRTPFIGKTIKPFVAGRDLLSYVEAILRVYNQYGRRDNIYKARIKILVHELGIEKFAQEVEEEWQQMRDSDTALTLDDAMIEDIRSRFTYPAYEKLPHMPEELKQAAHDPLFERWRKNSVFTHKVAGYAISPTDTPSAKSGSATSRIWRCPMSRGATCRRSGRRSTGSGWRRRTSTWS